MLNATGLPNLKEHNFSIRPLCIGRVGEGIEDFLEGYDFSGLPVHTLPYYPICLQHVVNMVHAMCLLVSRTVSCSQTGEGGERSCEFALVIQAGIL